MIRLKTYAIVVNLCYRFSYIKYVIYLTLHGRRIDCLFDDISYIITRPGPFYQVKQRSREHSVWSLVTLVS